MELTIKQLSQHGLIFVPLTTAEAVLVKKDETIYTLDKVLETKLELIITPAGSGINAYKQGTSVIITHSNTITANNSTQQVKIKYDSNGHIIETSPVSNLNVIVDTEGYILYNGEEEKDLILGDDFGIDNNKIALKWNNI